MGIWMKKDDRVVSMAPTSDLLSPLAGGAVDLISHKTLHFFDVTGKLANVAPLVLGIIVAIAAFIFGRRKFVEFMQKQGWTPISYSEFVGEKKADNPGKDENNVSTKDS